MNLARVLLDVRNPLRRLRSDARQSLIIVTLLSVGVGSNVAIFAALRAALLSPLPYPNGDRLVVVQMRDRSTQLQQAFTSYPVFDEWRRHAKSFESMTAFLLSDAMLGGQDHPLLVQTALVQSDFFRTAGVAPRLGRRLTSADEQAGQDAVVVLSYRLWTTAFGAAHDILQQTVFLDGRPYVVVGVMPREFEFPTKSVDLWRPLVVGEGMKSARLAFWASVVGRIRKTATPEVAEAELSSIIAGLGERIPPLKRYAATVRTLRSYAVGDSRQALLLLQFAVGTLLLIACVNVAGLLLLRGERRQHELAVRSALGATRGQLAAQLVAEVALLAVAGGLAGLGVGYIALRLLLGFAPAQLFALGPPSFDARLIAFDLSLAAACTLISALGPAVKLSRATVYSLATDRPTASGGRRHWQTRRGILVGTECAMAVILLVLASVFVRTLWNVRRVDRGFSPEQVITASVRFSPNDHPDQQRLGAATEALLAQLSRMPGTVMAGATQLILFNEYQAGVRFYPQGGESVQPEEDPAVSVDPVSADYFRVLKVPLVKGRCFNGHDRPDSLPVALVNVTAAKHAWPREDPIGKRFALGRLGAKPRWLTVVGVVGDMQRGGVEREAGGQVFVPLSQSPSYGLTVAVWTTLEPQVAMHSLREAVWAADKNTAVWDVKWLGELLDEAQIVRRYQTIVLTVLAVIALTLAAIGVFAVAHRAVTQRTPELGLRLALGAPKGAVVSLVLFEALGPVTTGVLVGVAVSVASSSFIGNQLYGVQPWDPLTLGLVTVGVLLLSLAASAGAARRATSIDPMSVLRRV